MIQAFTSNFDELTQIPRNQHNYVIVLYHQCHHHHFNRLISHHFLLKSISVSEFPQCKAIVSGWGSVNTILCMSQTEINLLRAEMLDITLTAFR